MRKDKEPTFQSIVEGWLSKQDDFRTLREIMVGTGLSVNRVSAALSAGHKHKAIGVMVDNNVTYWYPTPDTDDRVYHREEKVREEPGSRRARISSPRKGRVIRPGQGRTSA